MCAHVHAHQGAAAFLRVSCRQAGTSSKARLGFPGKARVPRKGKVFASKHPGKGHFSEAGDRWPMPVSIHMPKAHQMG